MRWICCNHSLTPPLRVYAIKSAIHQTSPSVCEEALVTISPCLDRYIRAYIHGLCILDACAYSSGASGLYITSFLLPVRWQQPMVIAWNCILGKREHIQYPRSVIGEWSSPHLLTRHLTTPDCLWFPQSNRNNFIAICLSVWKKVIISVILGQYQNYYV